MKKTIITALLLCIAALCYSFKIKSVNEDESNYVILTRNGGTLIISYGNGKSESFNLKSAWSDNAVKADNDIVLNQLNKLQKQGFEIKSSISSADIIDYSIFLEKK